MQADYRHTQYGRLMLVVFLLTGALIAWAAWVTMAQGRIAPAAAMIGLYILGVILFHSFTIEIKEKTLAFWFGMGIIKKIYPLAEIRSARAVISPWVYFWGIKTIPGGWLFAIAPGEAVEITLANGKKVRLGTDQSAMLKDALLLAMQRTHEG